MITITAPDPIRQFCIFTGVEIGEWQNGPTGKFYTVIFRDKEFTPVFCKNCLLELLKALRRKRHIIRGLFINNKLDLEGKIIHWGKETDFDPKKDFDLKVVFEEAIYPQTPKELYDNLFKSLYNNYNLGLINQMEIAKDQEYAASLYFRSPSELNLFFEAMKNDKLFAHPPPPTIPSEDKLYKITYQGIAYSVKLDEEGSTSNKCFIAMAFDDRTKDIREAIKQALEATGFEPVIVDEKNINGDKTIVDEIISNLRQCKFCISDFTYQRNGVYFEAGFAVGQGKPVIFTCLDIDFKNVHFDLMTMQHIIYKDTVELKKRLIDKINAWIK